MNAAFGGGPQGQWLKPLLLRNKGVSVPGTERLLQTLDQNGGTPPPSRYFRGRIINDAPPFLLFYKKVSRYVCTLK